MITIDREAVKKAPPQARKRFQSRNRQAARMHQVDRAAGEILDYSVITEGPALGHDMWVDKQFLADVARLGNAQPNGVKVRFTHPGLSSDGMGRALGRATNFRLKGAQVIADLRFIRAAYDSPDGNLADYVMSLAEEDPHMFGTSIVFNRDIDAEAAFVAEHLSDNGEFVSPERKNRGNLVHARISQLLASDVVDEPAANPNGLFSESDLPQYAEKLLSYIFENGQEPESVYGVHPERIKLFVDNYLARTAGDVEIPVEEEKMQEETPIQPVEDPVAETPPVAVETEVEPITEDGGLAAVAGESLADQERERCAAIIREVASLQYGDPLAQQMFSAVAGAIEGGEQAHKAVANLCLMYSRAMTDKFRVSANPDAPSVESVTNSSPEERYLKARQLCASNPGMTITEAMKLVARGSN